MTIDEFVHPEDAAALKTLESIPLLPAIIKKWMELRYEQMEYGTNMADKILLSPTQLPKLYNLLPPICHRLGIEQPPFFLEMNPNPNAYAFGDTYKAITINSGIVELLNEDELRAILAHECGHIMCRHMLYRTMAITIANEALKFDGLASLAKPIELALMYWSRKSELSSDRVAAFIAGPETTIRALSRIAGGPKSITSELNLVELAEQADQYDAIVKDGLFNKALQTCAVMYQTHPFNVVRIRELLKWIASDEYSALREKYPSCPGCYNEIVPGARFCKHCGRKL